MKSHQTKTDNSFFEVKVNLRLDNLPDKKSINVLDCFSGTGSIWEEIKRRSKKNIKVLSIDKERKKAVMLHGDNVKYIKSLDLSKFDVIDLDAYGVPYRQLNEIFKKKAREKVVFITFIQSFYGGLPYGMLEKIGIPRSFVRKIPSIFFRNGWEKFKNYLANSDVTMIKYINTGNKHYACFKI